MTKLTLAGGSQWRIIPKDKRAARIVRRFSEAMRLQSSDDEGFVVEVRSDHRKINFFVDDNTVYLSPSDNPDLQAIQLGRLSMFFSLQATMRGGLLIHGACAEIQGVNIVLAGPGGSGKSTSVNRLPPPWRSLCDDQSLIVQTGPEEYAAHPWPTWSRFINGEGGGTWDVQQSAPLKALFFLSYSNQDRAILIEKSDAACALDKISEQVWMSIFRRMDKEKIITLRRRRFENCCDLAKAIPCYRLDISPDGPFWEEIEKVIDISGERRNDDGAA